MREAIRYLNNAKEILKSAKEFIENVLLLSRPNVYSKDRT